ncbi:Outer membrane protein assembly factor BamB, contains PQQ-like beta-propeller repeat [Mariniphaga anaerophila]|uniref:Outer membrane protein assembly factor BamB, contains PQQ-like beta-propeller repeat n=1 Tax=Mariniphaga anaerophila TaxID=1484053 RepID=A0A1M5DLK9_9BACT|nr:PQQ-binding-like beta-propeller repeat protein [Mariniphaga anaerophila]SHF67796.1 Outer membrane protein assembly factor BamB, contains PQQ-like beta-propeller repeat [Mariniphaga anaerophila]
MPATTNFYSLVLLSFIMNINFVSAQNWTHFRGSRMDANAETEKAPLQWGENSNIVWKTPVKGKGWSSPVVYDNQIWLTSATDDGKEFYTVCYDFESGKLLNEKTIFTSTEPQRIHGTNSYATPTPCIEKGLVYVHYGSFGTACINTETFEVVWKREDLKCEHMQGPASSLVLHKNMLIVHLEGTENPYVVALNKKTGETIWKSMRPKAIYDPIEPVYRKSYQTPIIIEVDGRELMISNASFMCFAHDVNTGEVVWTIEYGYDSTVSQPLFWNGMVFVNSGWIFLDNIPNFTRQYAIDPTGKGDVTKTHVKWMYEDEVPQIPTPVIVDDKMYMVHDRGTVTCLDAATGTPVWKEKLKGNFNSSPVYAGGNIYFFNVKGECTIIKPGNSFNLVAENSIGETVKAVPAFLRGKMLLRTDKNLYLIE